MNTLPASGLLPSNRVLSVDLLRGLVMIVMALDHAREFFSYRRLPPEILFPGNEWMFFTRWVTHFVAPTFFFLAGAGAFLSLSGGKTKSEISRFLWTRGLWLIFLEMTVTAFGWTILFGTAIGGVLWALGWSMVLMSLLVRLPVKWVGGIGVAIVLTHNLLDRINPASFGELSALWTILHTPGILQVPVIKTFIIPYTIIPWVGVMAAGYAFGAVLRESPARRERIAFWTGAGATLGFVVLRITGIYGNPPFGLPFGFGLGAGPWVHGKTLALTVASFFNVAKYPPSLQFLLMTLGPALMLLAALDRATQNVRLSALGRFVLAYGRVPTFYYVMHIFLLHTMAVIVAMLTHQPYAQMLHGGVLAGPNELGYGHHLPFVYLMWAMCVLLLYFPCRWFAGVKARRKDWWLSYL